MNNVKILDCTLRDGGRVNGCDFPEGFVNRLIYSLADANIDIIEVGFLRDLSSTQVSSIRMFFTDVEEIIPYLPKNSNSIYVAFVDFGLYDFTNLRQYDGNSINGIRLAFTKKDFDDNKNNIILASRIVKENGYKLFLQGVNSLSYSDRQLLDVVDMVNEIQPYGFGIVDTYGSMYIDDVQYLYHLINHNLSPNVIIDFHSHNNFQLSYSFAQEVIRLSNDTRNIIIDATLRGMGKGAGNLNTELIVDYLVRKKSYSYNLEKILDIVDLDIYDLWKEYQWGYSPEYFVSGIYQTNPNNIIYLQNKYRVNTNDIKKILSKLSNFERNNNSYNRIDEEYEKLRYTEFDDSLGMEKLKLLIQGKLILVLAPGKTLITQKADIDRYIREYQPVILSANFISKYGGTPFFGNKKRYYSFCYQGNEEVFVLSDISQNLDSEYVLSAKRIKDKMTFDSGLLELLYLLIDAEAFDIAIAGMDGYTDNPNDNYADNSMIVKRTSDGVQQKNECLQQAFSEFTNKVSGKCEIKLITQSRFNQIRKEG
jgi:4-hydroxy 2-oxovalerate aldolase